MAGKVYAIKEGFDKTENKKVENKIVHSWNECLKYVKGAKGAVYKSFESMEAAVGYLEKDSPMLKKGIDTYPNDWFCAYVDGSYNDTTGKYGYAAVIVKDNVIVHIENGEAADNSKKEIRQIAGELIAAIKSLKYAIDNNIDSIIVFHDYVGVCYHATGFWERKEPSSADYYNEYNNLVNENNLKVLFVKVDSHTGDLFNELADEFAKVACSIPLEGEIKKYLVSNDILVENEGIKEKLYEIVPVESSLNIKIKGSQNLIAKSHNDKDDLDKVINEIKELLVESTKKSKDYIKSLDKDILGELVVELIRRKANDI